MRKLSKRSAIIAGATAVVIGGGAAAFAAAGWNIGGDGTATADAASITKMSATSSFGEKLYPGLKTQMQSKVVNKNEFAVKLVDSVEVIPSGIVVTGGADADKCKTDILKAAKDIIKTDFPGTPTIPAKTPDEGVSVTSAVEIGNLPQTCAGKNIKVTYAFSGVQQAA